MSKFCFKCGGVSENDAPVCAHCGAAFGDTPIPVVEEPVTVEVAPVEATPAEAPVRRRRTPPAKKSKKPLVIAAAIIAVVIFAFTGVVTMVGALGYFLFFAPEYTDPIDLYFAAMYEGKAHSGFAHLAIGILPKPLTPRKIEGVSGFGLQSTPA